MSSRSEQGEWSTRGAVLASSLIGFVLLTIAARAHFVLVFVPGYERANGVEVGIVAPDVWLASLRSSAGGALWLGALIAVVVAAGAVLAPVRSSRP